MVFQETNEIRRGETAAVDIAEVFVGLELELGGQDGEDC